MFIRGPSFTHRCHEMIGNGKCWCLFLRWCCLESYCKVNSLLQLNTTSGVPISHKHPPPPLFCPSAVFLHHSDERADGSDLYSQDVVSRVGVQWCGNLASLLQPSSKTCACKASTLLLLIRALLCETSYYMLHLQGGGFSSWRVT